MSDGLIAAHPLCRSARPLCRYSRTPRAFGRASLAYDFTTLEGEALWDEYQTALVEARAILARQMTPLPTYGSVCKLCHWHTFFVAEGGATFPAGTLIEANPFPAAVFLHEVERCSSLLPRCSQLTKKSRQIDRLVVDACHSGPSTPRLIVPHVRWEV